MKNGIILKKDIFAVPKMGVKIEQQFCSTEEFQFNYWWMENS